MLQFLCVKNADMRFQTEPANNHCTPLQLLQATDANQCTVAFSGHSWHNKAPSTQLPAVTRPSGECPHYCVPQLRYTAPRRAPLSSSYLKSLVVVIDINVRFKYFRVEPRAAICPLEATNQFHVPLPLVIALLLPFSAISSCDLRAVLLADECLRGLSEAPLVQRSKVLAPTGSATQSGCISVNPCAPAHSHKLWLVLPLQRAALLL